MQCGKEIDYNQILITKTDSNMYTVQWGQILHEKLTWDEMLGQVACLTLNGRSFFPVKAGFPPNGKDPSTTME